MALGNTATRIIVSVLAIPLIIAACFYGEIPFLIFVLGIGLISFWEFSELVKNKSAFPNFALGFLTILIIVLNVYFNFVELYFLLVTSSIIILLSELFRNKGSAILNIGSTFLGIFYVGILSSSILMIREFFW